MWERVSDWSVGTLVGLFGLVGLIMGLGARDTEMFIFGISLAVFAAVFIWSIYKRQTAAGVKLATVKVQGGRHG